MSRSYRAARLDEGSREVSTSWILAQHVWLLPVSRGTPRQEQRLCYFEVPPQRPAVLLSSWTLVDKVTDVLWDGSVVLFASGVAHAKLGAVAPDCTGTTSCDLAPALAQHIAGARGRDPHKQVAYSTYVVLPGRCEF